MKRFENTIEKLKSDPYFQIKVLALPGNKVLYNNINAAQMEAQAGGIEAFFESILQSGNTSLKIYDRRKNGAGFTAQGEPYCFDMISNTETAPGLQPAIPAIPAIPAMPAGLTGGMNGADFYRAMDYPKIATENQVLKIENAAQKAEITKLEKQILMDQFSESKAKGNTEALAGLVPLLMPLISRFIPAAPAIEAVGLTGSESQSDTKSEVIRIIQAVDEDKAYYIGMVAKNMHNEAFQNQLFTLLDRYQAN